MIYSAETYITIPFKSFFCNKFLNRNEFVENFTTEEKNILKLR